MLSRYHVLFVINLSLIGGTREDAFISVIDNQRRHCFDATVKTTHVVHVCTLKRYVAYGTVVGCRDWCVQVFSNDAKVTSGQTESGNVSACSLASVAPPGEAMPPECASNWLLQETASCGCELPPTDNIDLNIIKTIESNIL